MRKLLCFMLLICSVYPSLAQDPLTHTLQSGDTWDFLESAYDTCREAIIYQNDIALLGFYSEYYVMTEGTTFDIPPQSTCEDLPTGSAIHTVLLGETPTDIYTRYGGHPNQMPYLVLGDNPRPLFLDDFLDIGEQISIPSIELSYQTGADLIVIDEATYFEPIEHMLQVGDTLASLADTYQTCTEAIIWENQLMLQSDATQYYLFEEGDTLNIPPATACDKLPIGQYTITTEQQITQTTLIRQYRQFEEMYYAFNEQHAGLLPVGTVQVIPNIEYMFNYGTNIRVLSTEDETYPIAYKVKKGDTFAQLEATFDTCVEAILYVNEDLRRTSSSDPTFKILVGTEILIPSPAVCVEIPTDPIVVTIEEGDTLWGISYQHNTTINTIIQESVDSSESQLSRGSNSPLMQNQNRIEPGLKLVIPDGSWQYKPRFDDRLFVYDDDDKIVQNSLHLSLNEIAMCYGADVWEVVEINGLRDVQYTGGTLIIPNPQHDCLLRNLGYPDGILACYPGTIEQIAGLQVTESVSPVLVDEEDGAYCYGIRQVYETLFASQDVIYYDRTAYGSAADGQWGLTMAMINYCYRHDKNALVDITYDEYDSSIIPPNDDITIFARPEHITCSLDMFSDYYLYQVQQYDRLGSIAKAYGTHPDLIAQANNLDNPNLIYWGQYLEIPKPTLPHILQWIAGLVVLIISGVVVRRFKDRRTQKVKRKSKA